MLFTVFEDDDDDDDNDNNFKGCFQNIFAMVFIADHKEYYLQLPGVRYHDCFCGLSIKTVPYLFGYKPSDFYTKPH